MQHKLLDSEDILEPKEQLEQPRLELISSPPNDDRGQAEDVINVNELITDSTFFRYTGRLLKDEIPPVLTNCQAATNYTLKTAAFALGLLSGIGYVKPAVEFAGKHTYYGYLLGYGIFTSLAVVSIWAFNDITNDILSKSQEEKEITKRNYKILPEIVYWIFVPALGTGSSFPVSYLVYQSNDNNLFIAAVSQSADSITNTCSINRLYNVCKTKAGLYIGSARNQNLAALRQEFLLEMRKSIEMLPSLPASDLTELQQCIQQNDHRSFLSKFLKLSHAQLTVMAEHANWFEGLPKKIATAISILFPVAWAIYGLINAYDSFGSFLNELFVRWSLSVVTTLPYLILEIMLASAFISKIYDSIMQYTFNIYNPNMAQKFYPKFYFVAAGLGLFTTFNAYGARANFVTTRISGWEGVSLALMVSVSTVAYKSSAMLELINLGLQKFSARFSQDPVVREVGKLIERLERLTTLVEDASPEKFEEFSQAFKLETMLLQSKTEELQSLAAVDVANLGVGVNQSTKHNFTSRLWSPISDIPETNLPQSAISRFSPCGIL